MIFDNIRNAEKYYKISPGLEKALEHIKKCVRENTPPSRYEQNGMKVLVQEYEPIVFEDDLYECHREYADIQFIEKGQEEIHAIYSGKMEQVRDYNPEGDVEVFAGQEHFTSYHLTDGEFVCFFPGEAHKPSIAVDDKPAWTRKIVVKVKI
ncbi:MAG: YhcH/YjgK/YiaL family protein [Clostridia bacterium]|nr:YhcH/YjgK/YiaL family protein [Clostridia bacterium]